MKKIGFREDFFIPEEYMKRRNYSFYFKKNIDDVTFADYFLKFLRGIEEILTDKSLVNIIDYIESHHFENREEIVQNIYIFINLQYLRKSKIFLHPLDLSRYLNPNN